MKVVTILGARPQFIKAGSLSREFQRNENIDEIIIHTGQHYDVNMSDIFFDEMKIPKPDYFLGIGGGSHGAMTGRMLEKIEEILLAENPDWVIVYGDTNSTLAGALAASKLHIKIAHVEAGLRSFNMNMPEEINRILTDKVSSILFCPTQLAVDNLLSEGVLNSSSKVVLNGDVMQDGAIFYKKLAVKPNMQIPKEYVLCTIHRAENTNDISRLRSIICAINKISNEQNIILPLHPRTSSIIKENNIHLSDSIKIIEPIGYLNMVWLINNAGLIMTDSGGLQKEAYFFNKYCITLRDETEWGELVSQGVNVLAGADVNKIISAYNHLIKLKVKDFDQSIYGNGIASSKIIGELLNYVR